MLRPDAGGGPECPYLRRRRCLFRHSAGEAAAAAEVEVEGPSCAKFLELSDEVCALRRALVRLAAAVMWDRGAPGDVDTRTEMTYANEEKTIESSQVQTTEDFVEIPEFQSVQGTRTSQPAPKSAPPVSTTPVAEAPTAVKYANLAPDSVPPKFETAPVVKAVPVDAQPAPTPVIEAPPAVDFSAELARRRCSRRNPSSKRLRWWPFPAASVPLMSVPTHVAEAHHAVDFSAAPAPPMYVTTPVIEGPPVVDFSATPVEAMDTSPAPAVT